MTEKSMEQVRDELADEWWANMNRGIPVTTHATTIYKYGFDAAREYLEKYK